MEILNKNYWSGENSSTFYSSMATKHFLKQIMHQKTITSEIYNADINNIQFENLKSLEIGEFLDLRERILIGLCLSQSVPGCEVNIWWKKENCYHLVTIVVAVVLRCSRRDSVGHKEADLF